MKKINHLLMDDIDAILDAMHDDLLIADGQGRVIRVSPSFEKLYGIEKDFALGKTVYELEAEGYFKPSVIAKVIESGKKQTMRQKNRTNRDVIVSATPVFDSDQQIKIVVSFSRDITEMLQLQEQYRELEREMQKYTEEIKILRQETQNIPGVVGDSQQWGDILQLIIRVADFDVNLLFQGASGVGKTMLAKFVHQQSDRNRGPFIDLNCAAIPDNLLESELFGYEKGSFSGANANGKVGLIELAKDGTLLLDEISEMSLNLQAKLLKTIQDKTIMRVGGITEIPVDFRLITASNRDLEEQAERGVFRKDLLYRLNVITIKIPSLQERKEDIIPLVDFFLQKFNDKYNLKKTIHPLAMEVLMEYEWPGNAREVSNIIERALLTSERQQIVPDDLPEKCRMKQSPLRLENQACEKSLDEMVSAFEADIILEAYKQAHSTVGVSKMLKISQPTAHRKIQKYLRSK